MIDLATCTFGEWAALRQLDSLRQQFEAGDRMALLAAIRVCAKCDLPLPTWTSRAYIAAFDRVECYDENSWDAVFGTPYPKGANLKAMRKRRNLVFVVWFRVREIKNCEPGTAIDAALFARVGKEMRPSIGKTEATKRYYEAQKQLNPLLQKQVNRFLNRFKR